MDFANDLLNVIEEGAFDIPELLREGGQQQVRDAERNEVTIEDGRVVSGQFPFVIMTSNAERDFPPAFLRRCIRLNIEPPDTKRMTAIVNSQLKAFVGKMNPKDVSDLIDDFDKALLEGDDVSTDQLLNALFLTVAMRDAEARSFSQAERDLLKLNLMRALGEGG
jgi:MoxR-like ATPase